MVVLHCQDGEGEWNRRGRRGRGEVFSYPTKGIKTQSNPQKIVNKNVGSQRRTFFFICQFMTKRKDQNLTLQPSSKVGQVLGTRLMAHSDQPNTTVMLKALSQRVPDTVLNSQNIILGIQTERQAEPVSQLVSRNSSLQWASPGYLRGQQSGGRQHKTFCMVAESK